MLTAIYSGSFNPIHCGHTELCRYMAEHKPCGIDSIRLMVTPRNPLKPNIEMAPDLQRLEMVRLACQNIPLTEASDFEMSLQPPYFSLRTLKALAEAYPQQRFRLVIGADNWLSFYKWRNPEEIISRFGLIIYPRPGYQIDVESIRHPNIVYLADAPRTDISSTMVRCNIVKGKSISHLVPDNVARYIENHHLYTSPL